MSKLNKLICDIVHSCSDYTYLVEVKLRGVTLGDVTSGVIYKGKSIMYTYEKENDGASPLFRHRRHGLQQL